MRKTHSVTRRSALALAGVTTISMLAALAGVGPAFGADPAPGGAGATMKAVRMHDYGTSSVLQFEDSPKPAAGAGQVLVRVRAAGVNPVDWKVRSGMFKGGMNIAMPAIPGYDVAGTVEALGEGVKSFKVGDEVYAYMSLSRGGGYAQYAVVGEKEAAIKPVKADFEHAAAVPVAALTAWQVLFDVAKLEAGQTVLVHAGAGGVGHFAVQFAKWKGAKVIATASASNHEFLKGLGADVVIDYKTQKFEDGAKDVDVVLDAVGGETTARSAAVLKKGGILVSIVGAPDPAPFAARGAKATPWLVQPSGKQLAEIAKLIDEGKVTPHVSQTLPLADAAKAQDMSETGKTRGKIVLKVE
jgi:NADPH:quinone reductase-like Zn-dependent oxidoreductase